MRNNKRRKRGEIQFTVKTMDEHMIPEIEASFETEKEALDEVNKICDDMERVYPDYKAKKISKTMRVLESELDEEKMYVFI